MNRHKAFLNGVELKRGDEVAPKTNRTAALHFAYVADDGRIATQGRGEAVALFPADRFPGLVVEKEAPKPVASIDMTPKWSDLVPAFVALIENGTAEGRKTAIEELNRMARIADAFVAEHKGE